LKSSSQATTISIGAGSKTTVDTEVSEPGSVLEWEFMSTDKDCGFELSFVPTGGGGGVETPSQVLVANERLVGFTFLI
jgi:hypothetical protein